MMAKKRKKSSSVAADPKITYNSLAKVGMRKAGNINYFLHNSLSVTAVVQKIVVQKDSAFQFTLRA